MVEHVASEVVAKPRYTRSESFVVGKVVKFWKSIARFGSTGDGMLRMGSLKGTGKYQSAATNQSVSCMGRPGEISVCQRNNEGPNAAGLRSAQAAELSLA